MYKIQFVGVPVVKGDIAEAEDVELE